jgi:drug/metabolite transporter (DMT)-like permease
VSPRARGFAAATTVLFIWSSWLVVSRTGALSPLTVYDLAAIRYGVSAAVVLPIVLWLKPWRGMSVQRIAAVTFLLGPIYVLLIFGGFKFAPAAHGGIYVNGVLPLITLTVSWLWISERATPRQALGAGLIVVAVVLIVADSVQIELGSAWLGDAMFFGSALFFGVYMVASRVWGVTIPQLLMCSSVINALLFVPVWALFLPTELASVSTPDLALQIVYQGVVPNLIGLLLVTYAVRTIGAPATSAFMAAVPGMGALLSLVFLDEKLGALGWFAIALLTVGVVMMALRKRAE